MFVSGSFSEQELAKFIKHAVSSLVMWWSLLDSDDHLMLMSLSADVLFLHILSVLQDKSTWRIQVFLYMMVKKTARKERQVEPGSWRAVNKVSKFREVQKQENKFKLDLKQHEELVTSEHGAGFVPYLWVGLARSWGAQRGDFGWAGGSPRGGQWPPSFSEPWERDKRSRRTRRTLRRLSDTKTSLVQWLVLLLNVGLLYVMDPPAAHREPVGFIFPHPDVGTSESHPERQQQKLNQTLSLFQTWCCACCKFVSVPAAAENREVCFSPQVQETSLGFLVKDDGWTPGISRTGVTARVRY